MPKVFISHSSKDGPFVEAEIVDLLRRHGIDHWYSKDDIGGGDQWVQRIIGALKQCDWFLIVLSPRSVDAKYVRYEVSWAVDNLDNGRIVPVLFDDCEPDKLHFALPFIQHIDFRAGRDLGKARAELLRRWGAAYVESGESIPARTPATPARGRWAGRRPAIAGASAVAAASAAGLAVWLARGERTPSPSAPPASNAAGHGGIRPSALPPSPGPATPKLSPAERGNRLVIATLPGLNGKWWFEEAPWLAPAFRAAALAAPAGAFAEGVDAWALEPEEVYDRLRARIAEHSGPAQGRWGWLVPARGAKAPDDEQLALMEAKVAGETATFQAHDWHTLAAVRHHLAAKLDRFAAPADAAYRRAIAAYDREGGGALRALCLSDYSWHLIASNYDAQAINQIDLAEDQVRKLGPEAPAEAWLFRAQLRAVKAIAYEDLSDWSSEARCLDEARALLDGPNRRPAPHPLQASIREQAAWMKMWRWDVEAAKVLFAEARAMRAHSEGRNPVSYLEKLHDLHGEAMIQRFRGHSRRAQAALGEILADIDAKLDRPEARGDEAHARSLIERKFNSLERLADCDLFDGRPALAVKALGETLGFGRENNLFKGGDRSDEVRLLAKQALAYSLAGDAKDADAKIKKALQLTPKEGPAAVTKEEGQAAEAGPRAWVDPKAKLYTRVIDALVRLAGPERGRAREEIREALRTRDERVDRDSHELLMLAADLLIASDRAEADSEDDDEAGDDADLMFALIKAIPPDSRDSLRGYLGRYHDTALGAKLGDEPGEVDDGVRRWAMDAWFGPKEPPPADKALLLLHFEEHMGHAVLCSPGAPARHFPLGVGRPRLGKPDQPRALPGDLAAALGGAATLVCWRPPADARDCPFPFDPPESARLEFQAPAPTPSE